MTRIRIGERWVGDSDPTYFIADISANHDGSLERAKTLIHLAAESGADAAKFQNFRRQEIVSQKGFDDLGKQMGHQTKWKKPVHEIYDDAMLPWDWTQSLKEECVKARIDFFSTPYDFGAVDMLDPFVDVYKIGSGDITWIELIEYISKKHKPVILSTGASDIQDVLRAVYAVKKFNRELVLMQCNTNYTASLENFKHIHLNVLKTYLALFPNIVLGLSDHTPGHTTVLGAIALGARVIEKHLTDDTNRSGPDHSFSMMPADWQEMVQRSRELEYSLGSHVKQVADNEGETVIVQRRCIRAARDLPVGTILTADDLHMLRPAPSDSIPPYELQRIVGHRLAKPLESGDYLQWSMLHQGD